MSEEGEEDKAEGQALASAREASTAIHCLCRFFRPWVVRREQMSLSAVGQWWAT